MIKYFFALLSLPIAFIALGQTAPTVSGINCKEQFEISTYPGDQLSITVCTFDSDIGDQVTIEAAFTIPDASFSVLNKGAAAEQGKFFWTPPENAHLNSPYTVNFIAKDKNGLTGTSSVTITVLEIGKMTGVFTETGCGEGILTLKELSSGVVNNVLIQKKNYPFAKEGDNTFKVQGLSSGKNTINIIGFTSGGANVIFDVEAILEGGMVFKKEEMEEFACPGKAHLVPLFQVLTIGTNFEWEDKGLERNRTFEVQADSRLKVYGENGTCKDTLEVLLNVVEPKPSFAARTGVGTVPFTISFENKSGEDADHFFWDFGDGTTSTEENPEHTYTIAGNYSVTLVSGRKGLTSCNDSVTIENFVNAFPTGIQSPKVLGSLAVYPNPARDYLYVDAKPGMERVSVINIEGKVVDLAFEQYDDQLVFDITSLDLGTYVMQIETENGRYTEQFVVGP